MKKAYLLVGVTLIFFIISPPATALFTPSYSLKGTLSTHSQVFFIGRTTIQGTFTGYPMKQMLNSSLVEDMGGFPLVGSCRITDIDTLAVVENLDITRVDSLADIFDQHSTHLTTYNDVNIITEDGLFLLGISKGNLRLAVDFPYAVSTFLPLEIIPNTIVRFFITVTNTPLTVQCSGDYSVLTTLSESGTIRVTNRQGTTLWSGASPNNYLIIKTNQFSVTQHPPLSLFPLQAATSTTPLTLSVSPAEPKDIEITELIESVSAVVAHLEQETPSEFINNITKFDSLIKTASLVTNGAMLFQQINDTLTIDRSPQRFSSTGFVRFRTLLITNIGPSSGPTLQADCKICFLGNHFYIPRAKQSSDGVVFPFEILIIWILALCIFVYIFFFVRPAVNLVKDARMKRYALIIHIIAMIAAFLLLDYEVNDLFGISACTALFTQGASTLTGTFLLLEGLLWVLGYLIFAIPIQLLSYSVLRLLGYGKGGNGVRKAIGDISIWVFCGLYLLMFINAVLSLIHFNTLVPMG